MARLIRYSKGRRTSKILSDTGKTGSVGICSGSGEACRIDFGIHVENNDGHNYSVLLSPSEVLRVASNFPLAKLQEKLSQDECATFIKTLMKLRGI